jgi:lysozyme
MQLRQYTTTGRVPGIGGDVGRNVFYGSETDWAKFLQSDRDPRHQHRLAAYGA